MTRTPLSIDAVEERAQAIVAAPDAALRAAPLQTAAEMLAMGEDVLEAWLAAKGLEPTDRKVEGFRLLGLHRQAAKGDPSFNACRETCRELVWHHNLVAADPAGPDTPRTLRMGAMVLTHLALFIGGKLQTAGLGEFCCSSRPLRAAEPSRNEPVLET
ncbi:MAG: hypothetical protein GC146_17090 [Limimaricola sp.]|uniref:hypothetical protein n=1 Tax=Limimaricola sp. TaxID=2211665 RepID=UPI001D555B6E|nr:hypothetical protein [Limimaricola sp.]MBI1418929.1 hypothetical protein [Limimaricola sp.]